VKIAIPARRTPQNRHFLVYEVFSTVVSRSRSRSYVHRKWLSVQEGVGCVNVLWAPVGAGFGWPSLRRPPESPAQDAGTLSIVSGGRFPRRLGKPAPTCPVPLYANAHETFTHPKEWGVRRQESGERNQEKAISASDCLFRSRRKTTRRRTEQRTGKKEQRTKNRERTRVMRRLQGLWLLIPVLQTWLIAAP